MKRCNKNIVSRGLTSNWFSFVTQKSAGIAPTVRRAVALSSPEIVALDALLSVTSKQVGRLQKPSL